VKKSNNGGKIGIQHAILIDFMSSNIKSSLRYKVQLLNVQMAIECQELMTLFGHFFGTLSNVPTKDRLYSLSNHQEDSLILVAQNLHESKLQANG
jgi:hypothetical protein